MSAGHIYVTEHEGVFVIRMVGDVRLTLCISFDQFIEGMLAQEGTESVLFDLREAQGIDSTTLGLMAKIAIGAKQQQLPRPVVIASNDGIVRLLESMGFEDIFEIALDVDIPEEGVALPLQELPANEDQIKHTVLEAHKILMDLNKPNQAKFHELVETLQSKFS